MVDCHLNLKNRKKYQGEMFKMSRIIKDMKVVNMSVGLTTIVEDMEVKDNFLEIMTIDHDEPSSALHATKKDITMLISHTRIELI